MLPKTASGVPGDVALDFGRSGGAFGDMQNLVGAALRSSRDAPAGARRLRPPPTYTGDVDIDPSAKGASAGRLHSKVNVFPW